MKAFYLLQAFLLTLILASCEKEIPYRIGDQTPQLIMNAMLETDRPENLVYLNLSHTHYTTQVTEGTVTLYINGRQAETAQVALQESTNHNGQPQTASQCRLNSQFSPGDVLRLEAVAENGKYRAWAEVTVPYPLKEIQVDTCLTTIKSQGAYSPHRRFDISLQDPAGQPNYYRLSIQYDNTVTGTNLAGRDSTAHIHTEASLINREDVILTDGRPTSTDQEDSDNGDMFGNYIDNRYNVFPDSRFQGTGCTLKVYSYLYERYIPYDFRGKATLSSTIKVRLLSLTETGYRYLRILNTLEDDDYDETLMEAAVVPSNVKGGLGLVDACSATIAYIKLPDKEIDYDEIIFSY